MVAGFSLACFVPDSYRDYSQIGFAKAKADGDGFFGTRIGEILEIFKIQNADDAGLLWQNADGNGFAKAKADQADFLEHRFGKFQKLEKSL